MSSHSLPSNPNPLQQGVYPPLQEGTANPMQHAVSGNRLRYWIFFCIMALVLCPTVSVLVGLNFHARDFSYTGAESELSGRQVRICYGPLVQFTNICVASYTRFFLRPF